MSGELPPFPPLLAQQNLYRLVFEEFDSVNAWARKYSVTQTTVDRIVKGKMDPSTKVLTRIAEAMTAAGRPVQPWQFLAPNFGAGLHEIHTTEEGQTRIVPIGQPAENTGRALQRTETWDARRNPGRRATDSKAGGQ